jgi:hypothetical protein
MKPFKIGDICVALEDDQLFAPIKSGDILEIVHCDLYKQGIPYYMARFFNHYSDIIDICYTSHNNLQKIGEL